MHPIVNLMLQDMARRMILAGFCAFFFPPLVPSILFGDDPRPRKED